MHKLCTEAFQPVLIIQPNRITRVHVCASNGHWHEVGKGQNVPYFLIYSTLREVEGWSLDSVEYRHNSYNMDVVIDVN